MLSTNPATRLGCLKEGTRDVLEHKFFQRLDFAALRSQTLTMPFVPKLKSETDTSHFDLYESELGALAQWDKFLNDESQARLDAVFGNGTAPDE